MKKIAMVSVLVLMTSYSAFSKTLTVECKEGDKSLNLVTELKNVNAPQQITSFTVNGRKQSNFKDSSKMPVFNKGVITLNIHYGQSFYSSASIQVQSCTDSFEATGKAVLAEYVGGFAGSDQSELTCSCELK